MKEIFPSRINIKKYALSQVKARIDDVYYDLHRIFPTMGLRGYYKQTKEQNELEDKLADLITAQVRQNLKI
mgnify:CR=1 FL=1